MTTSSTSAIGGDRDRQAPCYDEESGEQTVILRDVGDEAELRCHWGVVASALEGAHQHTWLRPWCAQRELDETFGANVIFPGIGDGVRPKSHHARSLKVDHMSWLEPFLVSTGVVAVAEIGDKTQLLAFVLSARFKKPWQVISGILAATITNHLLAGVVGVTVSNWVNPQIMRWILGVSFLAMAVWALIPDREAEGEAKPARFGAFVTTALTFFLLEMGDKTQLATVALSAKYQSLIAVTAGTTLGMMLADVPAVFIGDRLAGKIPLRLVHGLAAALFAIIGILVLCGVGG